MTDERPPESAPEPNAETPGAAPPVEDAASPAMPAYTPPAYTPPPVPPPAMPQPAMAEPAVAWAAPPAAGATPGQRTTLSMAAGILMIILGILGALAGLLIAVVGGSFVSSFRNFADFPEFRNELNGADPGAVLGGIVAFVGILVLVYSIVYLIGGIGILRSKNWGRVIGIVVGILSGLIWLSSFASAGRVAAASGAASGGGGFALVLLVIHVYIAVVLLFFWRTRASTA